MKCRQEGQDVSQIVQIQALTVRQATFQFCPFCSFFADSSFLLDFSLRRISGQVLANLERRCGQVERSGLQKPGSSRNILETCGISASVCSALQSRAQCNVEMKKKSHRKSVCLICCSGIEGCLAQTIRVKWHTQLLIQSIYQFMCTMMIHNFCIYAI